jgi:CPA2 family monovalent cation:H+ antiporter-2
MEGFGNAALVIAAAALLVFVMQRLRQSSIVAHLLLGIVVGPHALDLVPSSATVREMAEIGVVLLLFFIGLEFHVAALKRMAKVALLGTLLQMALTTAAVAALSRALGFTAVQGLAVGFCIALSSTAIVMKAFEDGREADTPWAQSSLAILLGQDLFAMAAIAATALLPSAAGAPAGPVAGAEGRSLWFLLGLPVLVVVARFALPRLFRMAALARNPELFALSSLAACFLVAVAAAELGASLVLGAFLGGMVFADTPYSHQIRADLATVKNLALGLFFLSIGMLVDLEFVAAHPLLLAGGLVAVVAVKLVVTTLVLRAFRIPWSVAAGSGLALAQVSEFVFVLAAGAGGALLGDAAKQLLAPLAVVTMLPTPLLVGVSGRFGRGVASLLGHSSALGVAAAGGGVAGTPGAPAVPLSKTRVVVVGYGPVGRTLCRILLRVGVRVCVIDLQPTTVERLKRLGREAVFGDATRRDVLLAAGLAESRCLIITLPDQSTRAAILATARAVAPRVLVMTRARYLDEQPSLERLGADYISYEEAEVAMELARLMLGTLGVARETLEEEVRAIRSEIAVRTGFTMITPRRPPESPASPAAPA